MSHTTKIAGVKIASISALHSAVGTLVASGIRCSLVENATPRAYYPGQKGLGQADLVLKLDDSPYDVGFYKQEDGTFEARTDFWGGHVARLLGAKASDPSRADQAKLGVLLQHYSVAATIEAARKKGLTTRTVKQDNGKMQVILTGTNL